MVESIAVGESRVGPGQPVFVIAEAGVNHNGNADLAMALVDAASEAGADAVKFQLFRVEEQISGIAPTAGYQRDSTGAKTMVEMARSYELPWKAHYQIATHCRDRGILYMASCFDPLAVDFYAEMGGEAIKVGSGEITNYPLLAHMAATGIPVLLSTGMSNLLEVAAAVELISEGNSPLALFHCTSSYPTATDAVNLRVMKTLGQAFHVPVGYSDHTESSAVAAAAVALGACMIEKHFTTDRMLTGPDHAMSLDPGELKAYIAGIREVEKALGSGLKELQPGEAEVQQVARRSLVSARTVRAGEVLGPDNTCLKRPATGIGPQWQEAVYGRIAREDIPVDVPIRWDHLQ